MKMTHQEAKVMLELLKLSRSRVQKEIEAVFHEFCKRDKHYFVKLWEKQRSEPDELFAVFGYKCLLCDVQRLLESNGSRCHVCNGLKNLTAPNSENADVCTYCGFTNLMDPVGVPRQNIPKEDVFFSKKPI